MDDMLRKIIELGNQIPLEDLKYVPNEEELADAQWLIDNPDMVKVSTYHDAGACWGLIEAFRQLCLENHMSTEEKNENVEGLVYFLTGKEVRGLAHAAADRHESLAARLETRLTKDDEEDANDASNELSPMSNVANLRQSNVAKIKQLRKDAGKLRFLASHTVTTKTYELSDYDCELLRAW